MATESVNPMAGLVSLIESRYPLKVLRSEYVLVDSQWGIHRVLYKVHMEDAMRVAFESHYPEVGEAQGVQWEKSSMDDTYIFHADVGNNILLLWDEVLAIMS